MARPQSQYVPRAGGFDTSNLPEGNRPSESYGEYDDFILSRKPDYGNNGGKIGKRKSRILNNADVEYMRGFTVNGYHVTVNRYRGDNSSLLVLIDAPDYSGSISEDVSMSDLNEFIRNNTK